MTQNFPFAKIQKDSLYPKETGSIYQDNSWVTALVRAMKSATESCSGRLLKISFCKKTLWSFTASPFCCLRWSASANRGLMELRKVFRRWLKQVFTIFLNKASSQPSDSVAFRVIRMTRNATESLGCDEALFKKIVKTCFNQRRKTLRNSIKPLFAEADQRRQQKGEAVKDHSVFLQNEIFNKRPEQLSVADFIALTNAVTQELS